MHRQEKIDQVMRQFAAAWQEGETDPRPFLEMVSEHERGDLESQIDLFLMTTPPKKWNPTDFTDSRAEAITERVFEASRCPSGAWPELLPALMVENRLKRDEVVAELADEIGADSPDDVERVGDYFHRMTWGTLDSDGVSDRVLQALGGILRTSAEALRQAGREFGRKFPSGEGEGPVYARTPSQPDQYVQYSAFPLEEDEAAGGSSRIDRLFTGGPSAGAGD